MRMFMRHSHHNLLQYLKSIAGAATPSAGDRRESLPVSLSGQQQHNNKRKRKLLSQKVHDIITPSGSGKRRSSVSDAGLLSVSGSLLDYTASPGVLKFDGGNNKSMDVSLGGGVATEPKKKSMRYNHFMDLFGTESNYVGILNTIVSVSVGGFRGFPVEYPTQHFALFARQLFQKPLEDMTDPPKPDEPPKTEVPPLNKSEVRAIFNNFSPIHKVHMAMLERFK